MDNKKATNTAAGESEIIPPALEISRLAMAARRATAV